MSPPTQRVFGEWLHVMSELLDSLGIDPQNFEWQDIALCRGLDTELYYDKYEDSAETARQIDEGCLRCPVFTQCFLAGADNEFGVWGGVFWNGSGKPDRNKNSHKTPEIWAEIQKRVDGAIHRRS